MEIREEHLTLFKLHRQIAECKIEIIEYPTNLIEIVYNESLLNGFPLPPLYATRDKEGIKYIMGNVKWVTVALQLLAEGKLPGSTPCLIYYCNPNDNAKFQSYVEDLVN